MVTPRIATYSVGDATRYGAPTNIGTLRNGVIDEAP